jgi:hypothetical protein
MDEGQPMNLILLHELFEYRDGEFYWRKRPNSRVLAGAKAGNEDSLGYTFIAYKRKKYALHRLIFWKEHGYLPAEVDHIDGNPRNNRIENLRAATHLENMRNAKLRKDNTSGIKGVCWNKTDKKWEVKFQLDGKTKHFGKYFDIDVAKFVCETMRHKYHKDFARHA